MRTKKLKTRAAAALLAIFLLLALCPAAVFAAEGEVRIGSLEDLRAFAGACASDSYSAGLRVILTADIDAEGEDISVPVFLGSFDGRGYRIYGLRITRSASDLGLFSRIGAGASVKNLRVEGEVIPGGSQSRVGGIAGENLGTIENCSFSGVVSAAEKVGGVAGSNGESGLISGCTVSGVVRGTESTGGVVGFRSPPARNTPSRTTPAASAAIRPAFCRAARITAQSVIPTSATTSAALSDARTATWQPARTTVRCRAERMSAASWGRWRRTSR